MPRPSDWCGGARRVVRRQALDHYSPRGAGRAIVTTVSLGLEGQVPIDMPLSAGRPVAAKVLVADVHEADRRLSAILSGYQCAFVYSLPEAKLALERQDFDLVLTGIHFDESRMFDFLRLVRAHGRYRHKPIVCIRGLTTPYNPMVLEGLEIAAMALGATAFVDLNRYPEGEADARLRRTVDRLVEIDGVTHPPG